MKKIIILLVALLILFSATVLYFITLYKPQSIKMNNIVKVNNFEECSTQNYIIMESYPRQCKTPTGQIFIENISNALDKTNLIRLFNPLPNQEIKSPLVIEGEARGNWYFEASFPIKLYDENNNIIAQTIAQAQDDWMTNNFVPFKANLIFNSTSTKGLLVLEKDNPSGLPENDDQLSLPVKLLPDSEKMKIKVFFNNNKLDPEISCTKVFPVEREIDKTLEIARTAIKELLKGTTDREKSEGFTSSLNSDIIIQSLNIKNKIAYIDFNDQLDAGVAGSCRVSAIRAQITETLKQFPSISDVVISINGRSEDILQP